MNKIRLMILVVLLLACWGCFANVIVSSLVVSVPVANYTTYKYTIVSTVTNMNCPGVYGRIFFHGVILADEIPYGEMTPIRQEVQAYRDARDVLVFQAYILKLNGKKEVVGEKTKRLYFEGYERRSRRRLGLVTTTGDHWTVKGLCKSP